MRKKIIFILVIIIIIGLLIFNYNLKYERIYKILNKTEKSSVNDEFIIEDGENNYVNIIISRADGIDTVEYPSGMKIMCNNEEKISIDYSIEENMEYTFKIIDSTGKETYETFITPKVNIQLTKRNVNTTLDEIATDIRTKFNENNVSTNFIQITTGDSSSTSTTTTNVSTIFSSWKSFGDGNWGYSSSSNWIYNTKNSSYMTGYYDPTGNYENIELEFEAKTTDGDDDMIGSMIRFNSLGNNLYSSYLFLLDRHDNGGGVSNGAYNGINKVVNSVFTSTSTLQKLSVNASKVWSRNTWQKYKFIAKGSTISAYLDGTLVGTTTDDSISSGTIGFVTYSQANTYFRNITMKTTKLRNLGEVIKNVQWDENNNIIINICNEDDTDLEDEQVINTFNENNIYYFALGNDTNKENIETFLENINNRGLYLNSSDIDASLNEVINYILEFLK
jgi:hypothetical protein